MIAGLRPRPAFLEPLTLALHDWYRDYAGGMLWALGHRRHGGHGEDVG
jgi:hypothetical protein